MTLGKQMSNYYAPCFYKIEFFVIPSYIELPCFFIVQFHVFNNKPSQRLLIYI